MIKRKKLYALLFLLLPIIGFAQTTITANFNHQLSLAGVLTLDWDPAYSQGYVLQYKTNLPQYENWRIINGGGSSYHFDASQPIQDIGREYHFRLVKQSVVDLGEGRFSVKQQAVSETYSIIIQDIDGDGVADHMDDEVFQVESPQWSRQDFVVYAKPVAVGQRLYIVPRTLYDQNGIPFHPQLPAHRVDIDANGGLLGISSAPFDLSTEALLLQNCLDCVPTNYTIYELDLNDNGSIDYLLQGQGSDISFIITEGATSSPSVGYNFGTDLDSLSYPTLTLNSTDTLTHHAFISLSGCNGSTCTDINSMVEFDSQNSNAVPSMPSVTVSTSPPVVIDQAINATFDVGSGGEATYNIPIFAVEGVAGMTPSVALSYNSNSGNGIAGMGWSIQGLSSISRCGQTYFHDNQIRTVKLDNKDRFCYNGQRLFAVPGQTYGGNGTQYKTDIDNYLVITSHGGSVDNPDYFTVVAKDGSTAYFGQESDAKQISSNKTLTWGIDRIETRLGNNPIRFRYAGTSPYALRIERIDYAYGIDSGDQLSTSYLEFSYRFDRPDIRDNQLGGARILQTALLEGITSYNQGNLIRDYTLSYKANSPVSLLESITECVSDSCLQTTQFEWPAITPSTNKREYFPRGAEEVVNNVANNMSATPGDFNGDGKKDLLYSFFTTNGDFRLGLAISNGTGFSDQSSFEIPAGPYSARFSHIGVADFNLDGKDDVYKCQRDLGDINNLKPCEIYKGTSSGISTSPDLIYPRSGTESAERLQNYTILDLNGDALPDFVYRVNGQYRVKLGQRTLNGNQQWQFSFSPQDITLNLPTSFLFADGKIRFQDMTGDGLPDAVGIWGGVWNSGLYRVDGGEFAIIENQGLYNSVSSANNWALYGKIAFDPDPSVGSNTHPSTYGYTVTDYNADGKMDVLWKKDGIVYLSTNKGNGFRAPIVQNISGCVADAKWHDLDNDGWLTADGITYDKSTGVFSGSIACEKDINYLTRKAYLDVNGDGNIDEVVYADVDGGKVFFDTTLHSPGVPLHRITQFDNGLGRIIDVSYKPLSDNSVYQAYTNSYLQKGWGLGSDFESEAQKPYAVMDIVTNSQVVAGITIANGSQSSDYTYFYEGALVEPARAGWLGFSKWSETDEQTNRTVEKTFRMDYPFNGMQLRHREFVTAFGGQQLVTKEVEYNPETMNACSGGAKHIVMASVEDTISMPINSASLDVLVPISVQSQNTQQDCFGNITYSELVTTPLTTGGVEDTSESRTISTSYEYQDNTARIKGLPFRETISHPDRADLVTEYSYTPLDLLDYELRQPLELEKGQKIDYSYDAVGNTIRRDIQALDGSTQSVQPRYERMVYDLYSNNDFRYLQESYNSKEYLVQKIESRNELGQPTRITNGLNALAQEIEYDEWGRVILRKDNTGAYTLIEYNDGQGIAGAVSSVTTKVNHSSITTSTIYYDALGREIATKNKTFSSSGSYVYTKKEYNAAGEVVKLWENCTNPTTCTEREQRQYDIYGRLDHIIRPDSDLGDTRLAYSVSYDSATGSSNRLAMTRTINDRSNSVVLRSSQYKNAFGDVVISQDDEAKIYKEYDSSGQLLWVSSDDESGKRLQNWYDNLGRKVKMIDSEKGTRFYEYTIFGEIKAEYRVTSSRFFAGNLSDLTPADYQKISFDYDELGRITERLDYKENNVLADTSTWTFDSAVNGTGLLHHETGGGLTKTYYYDVLGRPYAVEHNAGTELQSEFVYSYYDNLGRIQETGDTIGISTGVEHHYNGWGFFTGYSDLGGSAIYTITAMNSRGQITNDHFSGGALQTNTLHRTRIYNSRTGNLLSISVPGHQQLDYTYDYLGNITSQHNQSDLSGVQLNQWEYYCYDSVNRLVKTDSSSLSCDTLLESDMDTRFSALGRIVYKSGVGDYQYNRGGYNGTTSDAVTSAGGVSYHYDELGNLTNDGNGRVITYGTFDKPTEIVYGSTSTVKFYYGPDRKRWKREDIDSSGTVITYYIGGAEKVVKPTNDFDVKRYVGNDLLRTYSYDSAGVFQYLTEDVLLKDHLGSVHRIVNMDDINGPAQALSFTQWGQRRQPGTLSTLEDWTGIPTDAMITTRGYTGHEMVDASGLIHMNGRTYDPELGRMMQADPFIPNPNNPQSYNRYSYVTNNPLNRVDPTGYSDCPPGMPATGSCARDEDDEKPPKPEDKDKKPPPGKTFVSAKRIPPIEFGGLTSLSFGGDSVFSPAVGAGGGALSAELSNQITGYIVKGLVTYYLKVMAIHYANTGQDKGFIDVKGMRFLFDVKSKRDSLTLDASSEGAASLAAGQGGQLAQLSGEFRDSIGQAYQLGVDGDSAEYISRVASGGIWDYKSRPEYEKIPGIEAFGNFAFGATAAAWADGYTNGLSNFFSELTTNIIMRGAGYYQEYYQQYNSSNGHWYDFSGPAASNYGDQFSDQMNIYYGAQYYYRNPYSP